MYSFSRQNRHLQSLLLRRSPSRARPPHAAKGGEVARPAHHQTHLGRTLRRYQRVRRVLESKWRSHSKTLPAYFEGGAEETLPRAARGSQEKLEVLHGRRQRTRLLEGLPGSLRGDDPEYRDEARAVVHRSCRQQVVYAADRRFCDYPDTRRTPPVFSRGRQSQEERAGSRAPFPARPEGLAHITLQNQPRSDQSTASAIGATFDEQDVLHKLPKQTGQ